MNTPLTFRDLWLFAATSFGVALLFTGVIWVATWWKARQMKRDMHLPVRLAGTGVIRFEPRKRKRRGA